MFQEKGTKEEVLQHASARTLDTSERNAARNQRLTFQLQTRSFIVLSTEWGLQEWDCSSHERPEVKRSRWESWRTDENKYVHPYHRTTSTVFQLIPWKFEGYFDEIFNQMTPEASSCSKNDDCSVVFLPTDSFTYIDVNDDDRQALSLHLIRTDRIRYFARFALDKTPRNIYLALLNTPVVTLLRSWMYADWCKRPYSRSITHCEDGSTVHLINTVYGYSIRFKEWFHWKGVKM